MLADAIGALPPLASVLHAAVAPLREQRAAIRTALADSEALGALPTDEPYLSLCAVDGAYTLASLFIGDQVNSLAVSVRSEFGSGEVSIEGHRSDSTFLPHSSGTDLLAKTMMMRRELELLALPRPAASLVIIDGSHLTAAIALLEALASEGSEARDQLIDAMSPEELHTHLSRIATEGAMVACPKSDSSTDLAAFIASLGVDLPMRFPDKVLASLILEEGEVLVLPRSAPPWAMLDMRAHHVTSHAMHPYRAAVVSALEPLRDAPLKIAHMKPLGATTALRIETKGSISDFEANDYRQAVADDCAPPFSQEPTVQHLADFIAKSVSETAKVQLAVAQADLGALDGDEQLLEFMIRTYRTA